MKKASNILLLLAAIFGIFGVITLVILGAMFLMFTSPDAKEAIIKGIQDGTIKTDLPGTIEEQAAAIQVMLMGVGVGFLIASVFMVAGVVIYFLARSKDIMALYITGLVLAILCGSILGFLGALFGLIVKVQEGKKPAEAQ